MPIRAFPALGGLVPKVGGKPVIIGPYSQIEDGVLPTIRTLGYRSRRPRTGYPVIIHAKLALLGYLWRHDEGSLGHVEDVIGFTPRRLWISSANFTARLDAASSSATGPRNPSSWRAPGGSWSTS